VSYPYHRLLIFLVSRKVDVNEALARYGLPPVGGIWLARAKAEIRKNAPHAIVSYLGTDAPLYSRDGILDWANQKGIYPLWKMQPEFGGGPPPPDLDLAFRIFINPYSRAMMGLLLLSSARNKDISAVAEEKFDISLSGEVLDVYRKIFWDVDAMGRKSWSPFIEDLKTKEEIHYITLGLSSPDINEVREIIGAELVVDHQEIVDHIAGTAYMQYKRAMLEPIPEHAGAFKWAELALKAVTAKSQLAKNAPPDDDDLLLKGEGFKGLFSVQTTRSSHPTLADLQGVTPPPVNAEPVKKEA